MDVVAAENNQEKETSNCQDENKQRLGLQRERLSSWAHDGFHFQIQSESSVSGEI